MTYLLPFSVEDLRKLRRVANPLEDSGFPCVRSAHDENPETAHAIEVFFDFRRIHAERRRI